MDPLKSRMPQEPEYWDALAGRIAEDAAGILAENRALYGSWWDTLARRCPALAAAAVLGIIAGSLALWAVPAARDDSPYVEVARAIGPTDEMARLLLSEPAPPSVESLLPVVVSLESER